MIAIIDYDVGNLGAVANMLTRIGAKCAITNEAGVIGDATGILLPGNGSYDACVRGLHATGLLPLIERKVLTEKVPLLGICVGAQMLGRGSEEGKEAGLGWIDMDVRRLPDLPGLRVPHMGWTEVRVTRPDDALGRGVEERSRFYFVHSFYLAPARRQDVLLEAHYGIDFAAAVASGNIYGVQFHPEKSHRFGKALLRAFSDLC